MPAYENEQVFERVRAQLQHAADGRDLDVLLLPELLGDDVERSLEPKSQALQPSPGRPVRSSCSSNAASCCR